jgi:hypothetical protein
VNLRFPLHFQQTMRREGCLNGVATSKSKQRGKCRCKGCSMCHANPASKSMKKTKGMSKHEATEFKLVLDGNM